MRKNTSLYYLAVLGFALAVPFLLERYSSKKQSAPKPNKPVPAQQVAATPPAANTAPPPERTLPIVTPEYQALVSTLNGGLKNWKLQDKQFQVKGQPIDVVTTSKPQYYPLSFKL